MWLTVHEEILRLAGCPSRQSRSSWATMAPNFEIGAAARSAAAACAPATPAHADTMASVAASLARPRRCLRARCLTLSRPSSLREASRSEPCPRAIRRSISFALYSRPVVVSRVGFLGLVPARPRQPFDRGSNKFLARDLQHAGGIGFSRAAA
jgi:hypothetical protein